MAVSTPKSCTFLSYQSSNFHNKDINLKDINLSIQYKPIHIYIISICRTLKLQRHKTEIQNISKLKSKAQIISPYFLKKIVQFRQEDSSKGELEDSAIRRCMLADASA